MNLSAVHKLEVAASIERRAEMDDYKGVVRNCSTCEYRIKEERAYICSHTYFGQKIKDIYSKYGRGKKSCWSISFDAYCIYVDSLPEEERRNKPYSV